MIKNEHKWLQNILVPVGQQIKRRHYCEYPSSHLLSLPLESDAGQIFELGQKIVLSSRMFTEYQVAIKLRVLLCYALE